MKRVKILLGIVLFVILMVFALSNKEEVRVHYWGDRTLALAGHEDAPAGAPEEFAPPARPVPLFVVIFGCFGLGFAVSWLFGLGPHFRMRSQLRRCRRTTRQHEKELAELRAALAASAAAGPEPPASGRTEPAPPPVE